MITITCGGCGKTFTVSDDWAGRQGACKSCGAVLVVPHPPPPKPPPRPTASRAAPGVVPTPATAHPPPRSPAAAKPAVKPAIAPPAQPAATSPPVTVAAPGKPKLPMRTRRLWADAEAVRKAFQEFPLIRIHGVSGNPPERYQIVYQVRGLQRGPDGHPVYRDQHVAEIVLTHDYPRQSPLCRRLTPIFHPNIEPSTICVGDHWTAGERLVDLIIRIGELIAYQAYNVKSPLDGEAAMWADQNARHLPVDTRDLRPPNMD